jgi:hypothetical protein
MASTALLFPARIVKAIGSKPDALEASMVEHTSFSNLSETCSNREWNISATGLSLATWVTSIVLEPFSLWRRNVKTCTLNQATSPAPMVNDAVTSETCQWGTIPGHERACPRLIGECRIELRRRCCVLNRQISNKSSWFCLLGILTEATSAKHRSSIVPGNHTKLPSPM